MSERAGRRRWRLDRLWVGCAALALFAHATAQEAYPSRPIRMVLGSGVAPQ